MIIKSNSKYAKYKENPFENCEWTAATFNQISLVWVEIVEEEEEEKSFLAPAPLLSDEIKEVAKKKEEEKPKANIVALGKKPMSKKERRAERRRRRGHQPIYPLALPKQGESFAKTFTPPASSNVKKDEEVDPRLMFSEYGGYYTQK